jgi:hypothetical protein
MQVKKKEVCGEYSMYIMTHLLRNVKIINDNILTD